MSAIKYKRIFNGPSGGGSGGTNITAVVANYSALPAVADATGNFYWVSASQGTAWLPGSLGGTYYPKGLYYSNGVTWEYTETPAQATQLEVNTGTNTDKFVTPSTLTNATKWTNYQLLSGKDAVNGYVGLTGRNIIALDPTGLIISYFDNANLTANRNWLLPDQSGTIALLSDVTSPPYVEKTANYTITTADYTVNCTTNSFTVTLPSAIGIQKQIFNICNSCGAGKLITLNTTLAQTIYMPGGEVTSVILNDGEALSVQSTGANYRSL